MHTRYPAKSNNSQQGQQGIALFSTLLIVIIFTFIAIGIATKGKKNQELTGATLRNHMVFEATEMTIQNAISFIRTLEHPPPTIVHHINNDTKNLVQNFKVQIAKDHAILFTSDPTYAFIWQAGTIANIACPLPTSCPDGFSFSQHVDNNNLWQHAIESTFEKRDYGDTYFPHIKTYTFIERFKGSDNTSNYGTDGNLSTAIGNNDYYFITVKGSGFPPQADKSDIMNARENTILQIVYTQPY